MKADWEARISRATRCHRCNKKLDLEHERILSVYDDQAICMECKKRKRNGSIMMKYQRE